MDFSQALTAVKPPTNHRIARAGWNGKNMWVAYSPGFCVGGEDVFSVALAKAIGDDVAEFLPYLLMKTIDGDFVPWLASQTDILANDWEDLGE